MQLWLEGKGVCGILMAGFLPRAVKLKLSFDLLRAGLGGCTSSTINICTCQSLGFLESESVSEQQTSLGLQRQQVMLNKVIHALNTMPFEATSSECLQVLVPSGIQ